MSKRYLHIRLIVLIGVMVSCLGISYAQDLSLSVVKQEISCHGIDDGIASVIVTGGQSPYSYLWSNGAESQTINNIGPGTYLVTVTDQTGSTSIGATGLLEVAPIEIELISTDGICGKFGEIEAIVSGGLGPIQYRWSNGDFARTIRNLEEGEYSLTITDRGNCATTESAEVIVNGEGLKLTTSLDVPTCTGSNNGSIATMQTGGQFPIDYMWSNGSTATSISNIPAGTYSVFAIDGFGCTDGLVIQLPDPVLLTVDLVNQNESLYAQVEGGTPDYEYTWSNGVTGTTVLDNLPQGSYSITVEDANGCEATDFEEILGPLSQDNITELIHFSISPTLVQTSINIEMVLGKSETIQIEIFTLAGQRMYVSEHFGQRIDTSLAISNQWNKGLYLLRISSNSGWSFTDRFIKI